MVMLQADVHELTRWLEDNFGDQMEAALASTPFSVELACAIACKETGIYLLPFARDLSPADAIARCVFDASGDAAGTSRNAFPRNTDAFREAYGDDLTEMLIDEANQSRLLRGLDQKDWVYKGYGPFQYDLQHIGVDIEFFRDRLWYDFDECLRRFISEMQKKLDATDDLGRAIQAYNGSGLRAAQYRADVEQILEIVQSA